MNNAFVRRAAIKFIFSAAFLLFGCKSSAQYTTNGIYAEFNTSMGSYTCALYYAQAPKAVANFIGLATGQRAWLDLPSGVVKTNPFYNGLTFHRVITNFMNQAGSRNGLGTDGPGYAFVDEVTNTLQFDSYGTLAMANSGPATDSNGSQFFITGTNSVPGLNNGYTVFGKLFGGSNVVYAINRTPTSVNPNSGAYEIPITPVYINSIKIVTNGAAATAFNIHAQGLPLVTNLNLKIAMTGPYASLSYSNRLYSENRIYTSSNLAAWTPNSLGMDNSLPLVSSNLLTPSGAGQFFRGVQIRYSSSTGPPRSWAGKTLTLFYTSGVIGTNVIAFNSAGGGTYTYNSTSTGTVVSYTWTQGSLPYNGSFVPIYFSSLPDHAFNMHWKSGTSGTFSGYYYASGFPFSMSGTFTNSP